MGNSKPKNSQLKPALAAVMPVALTRLVSPACRKTSACTAFEKAPPKPCAAMIGCGASGPLAPGMAAASRSCAISATAPSNSSRVRL